MSNIHSNPLGIHPPAGQYSHAVLVPAGADTLYIAGQVGARADGSVAEGFEAQVRQTFDNLLAVLSAQNMDASDLVQITYYMISPADAATLRSVRAEYLPEQPPASTALLVSALVRPEWLFELDAVAARKGTGPRGAASEARRDDRASR